MNLQILKIDLIYLQIENFNLPLETKLVKLANAKLATQVNLDHNLVAMNLQILKVNLHLLTNRVLYTINILKIKQS